MILCWNKIENLYLVKSKKYLKDKKTGIKYIEKGPCKNCGNYFLGQPNSKGNYCSRKCASDNNNNNKWKGGYRKKGIPRYDLYFKKIQKYEKVRRSPEDKNILEVSCCKCGEYFVPKLGQLSDRIQWIESGKRKESKFYCSDDCKNSCIYFNQKKYAKGFELKREYPKNWDKKRKEIKERDNWECQNPDCKKTIQKSFNITVHHIDYDKNNCDDINLITLCRSCNSKANFKKEYFILKYSKILYERYKRR